MVVGPRRASVSVDAHRPGRSRAGCPQLQRLGAAPGNAGHCRIRQRPGGTAPCRRLRTAVRAELVAECPTPDRRLLEVTGPTRRQVAVVECRVAERLLLSCLCERGSIEQGRAGTQGELLGDLEIVRIPLDLVPGPQRDQPAVAHSGAPATTPSPPRRCSSPAIRPLALRYFQSISLGFECADVPGRTHRAA